MNLRSPTDAQLMVQFLPADFSSLDGFHTLNRAVDMQVAASQHIYIALYLASGTASEASCTATGTLSVLQ